MLTASLIGLVRTGRAAHTTPNPAPDWMEKRGVYLARHLWRGKMVLYAVDSSGEVIRWVPIRPSENQDTTRAYLWELLELRDPMMQAPVLALVRTAS